MGRGLAVQGFPLSRGRKENLMGIKRILPEKFSPPSGRNCFAQAQDIMDFFQSPSRMGPGFWNINKHHKNEKIKKKFTLSIDSQNFLKNFSKILKIRTHFQNLLKFSDFQN